MADMGNSSSNCPGALSDMPLNPGGTPNNNMGPSSISSGMANNKMSTPFDPISSMAHMSQQLTSQFGPGQPLYWTPPPPIYSTPPPSPRRPPSLELRQRFSGPMSGNFDSGNPGRAASCLRFFFLGKHGMGHKDPNVGGGGMGGPIGDPGNNPMMMGGGGGGPNPNMYNPASGGKNSSGPGDPLGGPNQGPPGGGGPGGFKSSPFMGPTTNDPNYAQQFHNFQQQLYATNTRSQMSNNQQQQQQQQAMGAAGQPGNFFGHK